MFSVERFSGRQWLGCWLVMVVFSHSDQRCELYLLATISNLLRVSNLTLRPLTNDDK